MYLNELKWLSLFTALVEFYGESYDEQDVVQIGLKVFGSEEELNKALDIVDVLDKYTEEEFKSVILTQIEEQFYILKQHQDWIKMGEGK